MKSQYHLVSYCFTKHSGEQQLGAALLFLPSVQDCVEHIKKSMGDLSQFHYYTISPQALTDDQIKMMYELTFGSVPTTIIEYTGDTQKLN